MIVVDTSAIVALLFGEPAASDVEHRLLNTRAIMSATTLVELGIVVEAKSGPAGTQLLDELLRRLAIDIEPVDAPLAADAIEAWRRFGKGRHPAALNFGDTFSYALARRLALPLLFVGDDFAQTDITSAL